MKIYEDDSVYAGVLLSRKSDGRLFTQWCYAHAYDFEDSHVIGDPKTYDEDADVVFVSRPVRR